MNDEGAIRNIPHPIKREVRQRCGFGCVICGNPLYEYEHMLGWAEVQRHAADEITLLCNQHHTEKTKGLLPIADVIEANNNPYNIQTGTSSPYYLHYSGDRIITQMGSNTFTSHGFYQDEEGNKYSAAIPLTIDSVPIIGFIKDAQRLFLNLQLYDEYNECVLEIRENELMYAPDPWDIEFVGKKLTIREAQRKILLNIEFDTPYQVIIHQGRILLNGVEVLIQPDFVFVTNSCLILQDGKGFNPIGIAIGVQMSGQPSACLRVLPVPRYNYAEQSKTRKEILQKLFP